MREDCVNMRGEKGYERREGGAKKKMREHMDGERKTRRRVGNEESDNKKGGEGNTQIAAEVV